MPTASILILASQLGTPGISGDAGLAFFLAHTNFGSVWVDGVLRSTTDQAILLGEK